MPCDRLSLVSNLPVKHIERLSMVRYYPTAPMKIARFEPSILSYKHSHSNYMHPCTMHTFKTHQSISGV